jgi:hypothetical protein
MKFYCPHYSRELTQLSPLILAVTHACTPCEAIFLGATLELNVLLAQEPINAERFKALMLEVA